MRIAILYLNGIWNIKWLDKEDNQQFQFPPYICLYTWQVHRHFKHLKRKKKQDGTVTAFYMEIEA